MATKYGPFSILVPQGHYEQAGDGRRWVQDEPKRVNVTLEVDVMELVRRLGFKASLSRTGKATALYGLVVVKEAR